MKLIRARVLLTQCSPPIENGALIIHEGRIVAVGRYIDLVSLSVNEHIDLGEQILLPGLINAHCHLDYTNLRGSIPAGKIFSQWLQCILTLKETQTQENYLNAIGEGFQELLRWGTTSVFNIGSVPEIMVSLATPQLRTWWFHELIDIRSPIFMEERMRELLKFSAERPDWLGGFGLSPHAPYTASQNLYRDVKWYAEKYKMPVTTHLAETVEELEMFRDGCGPLFEFLKALGCSISDFKTQSPVAILLGKNLLPRGSILAHMNFLEEEDWKILQKQATDFTVAHCPKTHAYFKREDFHFKRLRESRIPVCLGTDSLASNDSLSLFEEMRLFVRLHGATEQEVLDMVTLHPAKAIGLTGRLGTLAKDACADLIAIPYSDSVKETVSAVVNHSQPIAWTMIQGVSCS